MRTQITVEQAIQRFSQATQYWRAKAEKHKAEKKQAQEQYRKRSWFVRTFLYGPDISPSVEGYRSHYAKLKAKYCEHQIQVLQSLELDQVIELEQKDLEHLKEEEE